MIIKEILKVMRNERQCILNQYDGSCDNKRDCESCTLALDKDEILQAYDYIVNKLSVIIDEISKQSQSAIPLCTIEKCETVPIEDGYSAMATITTIMLEPRKDIEKESLL